MTSNPDTTLPSGHADGADRSARLRTSLPGRSGLVVAALMLGLALYLTVGIIGMEIPGSAATPGPAFFPIILAACAYLIALLLTVEFLRHPEEPDPDIVQPAGGQWRMQSDWRALGLVLAGLIAFTALLLPLGWILAAALLFWTVAYALGSTRPVLDIVVSLTVSCAVQAFFSAGLGLNLPAGVLGGLF
ncbi:tripartite tricarboxylate transporter TctB family protein [Rhodococcus pyridinivorans]|uniref:tripartite tricarboxylate transporter TctB family protein n=1 Tax=Rhodococcus pyridinivorans TaxID=103816 RepID=UPI0009C0FD7C|nr:tripartite tricarboxylate transporter TctB family protein [Rhodococcus pyridinivorans]